MGDDDIDVNSTCHCRNLCFFIMPFKSSNPAMAQTAAGSTVVQIQPRLCIYICVSAAEQSGAVGMGVGRDFFFFRSHDVIICHLSCCFAYVALRGSFSQCHPCNISDSHSDCNAMVSAGGEKDDHGVGTDMAMRMVASCITMA